MGLQSNSLDNKGLDNLTRALAVSLVLHAILLWQAPLPAASQYITQPLTAFLRQPDQTLENRKAHTTLSSTPLSPSVVHSHSEVRTIPRPRLDTSTQSLSTISSPQHPSITQLASVLAQDKQENNAVNMMGSPTSMTQRDIPRAGDRVDADGLRQYRLSLASMARRFKRYPPQAEERGWVGTAEIHIAVGVSGITQPPQLARSSGHPALDEAAVDMLDQAAQRTSVPRSLLGQAFVVSIPVEFKPDGY